MKNAIGSVGVTSAIDAIAVNTTAPPLRTMSSASPIIGPSATPTVSSAESAITPRVEFGDQRHGFRHRRRRNGWRRTGKPCRACASTISTTTIFSAPASRAPWIAPLPIPPQPITTTVSPGLTSAVLTAEPQPVVTPQPRRQARDSGRSSSILTTDASDTVPYWAKVPSSDAAPTSWPSRVPPVGAVDLRPGQDECAEVAQVLVSGRAPAAAPACRQEGRHDVVAHRQVAHAGSDLLHDARRPRVRR